TGSLGADDVYLLGRSTSKTGNGHWVARVNAGGPTLFSTDDGPDWTSDTDDGSAPYHDSSTEAVSWGPLPIIRRSDLPDGVPTAIFHTERTTRGDAPLAWDFAAPRGSHLTVRLYFSYACDCTK